MAQQDPSGLDARDDPKEADLNVMALCHEALLLLDGASTYRPTNHLLLSLRASSYWETTLR